MEIYKSLHFNFKQVFEDGVFGMPLADIGIIIFSILIALFIRGIFAKIIVSKLRTIIKKTDNTIDDRLFDALIPPFKLLPIVIVFLTVTLYFDIQSTLGIYLQKINSTLSTIFVFSLIHQSLIPFSNFFHRLEKILTKELVLWIIRSLKYLIIFLGIVAVLELWGIKIGPVIAGLGLFGVAVALGAQDLFKNLFSGIMILLEKRFQLGDVINVPGHTEGTVEHIGFRSTLIRKFDSTPITIPNYIFAEAPIMNYSNRFNRRINWNIGLTYETSISQLKKISEDINNYITKDKNFIVNDNFKCFIKVEKFNDSSIDLLIYCFVNSKDWDVYLKTKENLALKIKEIVEDKNNANFAFPSSSIYIEKK